MGGICGVTVCVNYDDFLSLTLRRNMSHLHKCVVVTSHEDDRVTEVVRGVEGVELFRTDAFTRNGAIFNKAQAIEDALEMLDHSGWILLFDADIMFPETFARVQLERNVLYGVLRHQLPDGVADIDGDWTRWELVSTGPRGGYFQLFHAQTEALSSRPWYPTNLGDGAAADSEFSNKFAMHLLLPDPVLHIAPSFENWFGRVTPRLDGAPVPDAEQNRLRMGEHLLSVGSSRRPDLQELALAARQTIS